MHDRDRARSGLVPVASRAAPATWRASRAPVERMKAVRQPVVKTTPEAKMPTRSTTNRCAQMRLRSARPAP